MKSQDPLTYRYPRYPFQHATPAEYAKSVEGPEDDLESNWLYGIALVVSILSVVAVVGIVVLEMVTT